MLAIDTKQSIWIQHSIPRFAAPFNSTEFQYPSNALQNGQHIVCVTLDTNRSVDQVLQQLLIMRPSIYASNHDPKYLKAHPAFDQLINRKFSKTDFKQLSMRTAGGMTFQHFAKSPRYRRELYVDLIAPALQINLTVQSWRNGAGGRLKSSCNSTFDVFNIEEVRIQGAAGVPHGASSSKPKPKLKPKRTAKRDVQALPLTSGGIVWKSTEDHSKWAAAEHGKRPIACLGDVNRMRSQFVRGGGAVCIQNAKMWRTISGSALETEPCPIH